MKPEDLQVLAERASTVEGRPATRLEELHGRIEVARRRRQVGTVSAAVVAVVLALTAGVGLLALTDPDRTPPAEPAPRPTATPGVPEHKDPPVRRLTYAVGNKIHWGDRVVDVGGEVSNVTATDDGVVYVRDQSGKPDGCFIPKQNDRCNTLWFADESGTGPVGTVYGSVIRGFWLDSSSNGSTLVWFEPSLEDHPHATGYDLPGEYVVYDTRERREVARMGSEGRDPDRNGHNHLLIQAVFGDYVYWTPDDRGEKWCLDYSKYYEACRHFRAVMRLDTATGTQTEVPWGTYISDRRSRPRMFSRPIRGETNTPGPVYDQSISFLRDGDRLVADDGGGSAVTARMASTGEPVQLRLASGYPDVDDFFVVAWLDDHRVVLQAGDEGLLVCRLPDGRCRAVVKGPVLADFGGRG